MVAERGRDGDGKDQTGVTLITSFIAARPIELSGRAKSSAIIPEERVTQSCNNVEHSQRNMASCPRGLSAALELVGKRLLRTVHTAGTCEPAGGV